MVFPPTVCWHPVKLRLRHSPKPSLDWGIKIGSDPYIPPGLTVDNPLRRVVGQDQRQLIRSAGYPWSTIGQIHILVKLQESGEIGIGSCTGSLIAPDVIVTNAHCVKDGPDPKTGQTVQHLKWWFFPNAIDGKNSCSRTVANSARSGHFRISSTNWQDANSRPLTVSLSLTAWILALSIRLLRSTVMISSQAVRLIPMIGLS